MFRLNRTGPAATGRRAPNPLRRAALFGGGLVCLWGALQLAPLPEEPEVTERAPLAVVEAPVPDALARTADSLATDVVLDPAAAAEADPAAALEMTPADTTALLAEATPAEGDTLLAGAAPMAPALRTPEMPRTPLARPITPQPQRERGIFRLGNILAFLLLAGGVGFAYHLHRKKTGARPAAGAAPAMGVLGELSLGAGQAVRLVRVQDEVLVLGVTQTGVNLLHRYPYAAVQAATQAVAAAPPEAADAATVTTDATADAPATTVAPGSDARLFADVLRQYVPIPAHA